MIAPTGPQQPGREVGERDERAELDGATRGAGRVIPRRAAHEGLDGCASEESQLGSDGARPPGRDGEELAAGQPTAAQARSHSWAVTARDHTDVTAKSSRPAHLVQAFAICLRAMLRT